MTGGLLTCPALRCDLRDAALAEAGGVGDGLLGLAVFEDGSADQLGPLVVDGGKRVCDGLAVFGESPELVDGFGHGIKVKGLDNESQAAILTPQRKRPAGVRSTPTTGLTKGDASSNG